MTILDRRLTPARPDLAALRLRGIVDAPRFVDGIARRLVAPSAPLLREPRRDSGVDTEALMGEAVTVYDEHEGFSWVQFATDGYVGYLPSEALGPDTGEPSYRVTALRTFVYPGPDLKLPHLHALSMGARVTPTEAAGEYLRLASGGYVAARHLAPAEAAAPDFVAVAERFLGTPYLWGGRTSLGLDCSGLVQLSLAMAGIPAPRDTDMQAGALGRAVPHARGERDPRRGDLVFWRGHVGIMQDATRLLHANGHHMEVVSEKLAEAEERILGGSYGPVTTIRRVAP